MRTLAALLLLFNLVAVPHAQTRLAPKSKPSSTPKPASGKTWPYSIPMRSKDGANKDLFVMTLGDVETSLADGTFDPKKDEATLKSGEVTKDYYRNKLGVKFYSPLDKSRFALPPSGWCTWYFYYQHITEGEVKQNAQWIADNLKDYGAQYVQIDDGWQGNGRGSNRDWSTISNQFPGGMDKLAAHISSLGLTPGIWLAPHGQSNETVVKNNPGVFLLKPDGTSASETWEGKYLVDPTNPESMKYLKDLFTKLSGWGYDYFKIDGQPIVVNEYRTKKAAMKTPSDDGNGLYRQTLDTIREAIGPDKYLLGCWGIPVEGMGIMNGSRTGGDIVLGWEGGFMTSLRATMQHYYQHNVAWYVDPDVMLLRSPLTIDQARAWATLQGLTGQAVLASDRLMDLSEDRVELMRRVYPAVDIRPLDLFPTDRNKKIFDLKVNHLDRRYDVVGLFNYTEGKQERINLNWKDLGLNDNVPMHVFDFWNKEYLGAWENGISVDLAPTSTRVLTVMPSSDKIQLISTNRHITQGWVDLQSLNRNDATNTFTGKSNVVKNDKYELQFVFPRGKNFKVKVASARTVTGKLPVTVANHQGWSTIQIVSPKTGPINWTVSFEPAESYVYPVREPTNVSIERVGLDGVNVRWAAQYYLNAGYQVYVNGNLMGYTPNNTYVLRGLEPEANYTVEVKTVWDDGKTSEKAGEVKFSLKPLLPRELALTVLDPARTGVRAYEINRTTTGRPFSVNGKRYDAGIGSRSNGEVEFDIKGVYDSFRGAVGVDDSNANENTALEFVVTGDGKELWRSGQVKKSDSAKSFEIDVKGVKRLVLRVVGQGQGQGQGRGGGGSANWLDARVVRND